MDFGKPTDADKNNLTEKHFLLTDSKQAVLSGTPQAPVTFIGLPKWGRPEWAGKLYPANTKEKEFLDHYVTHFNCIELNATHYKIHSKETIAKWASKAGDRNFLFCPKMYQGITHRGSLKGKSSLCTEFFDSIAGLGNHLGPVFIQLSDTFSTKREAELFGFLTELPAGFEFFLELRHGSWFETAAFDQLVAKLVAMKIGLIITDTVTQRQVVHLQLTIPKVMIRFGWMGVPAIDIARIRQWKAILKNWCSLGLQTCFFFLHVSDEAETPEFAAFVKGELDF